MRSPTATAAAPGVESRALEVGEALLAQARPRSGDPPVVFFESHLQLRGRRTSDGERELTVVASTGFGVTLGSPDGRTRLLVAPAGAWQRLSRALGPEADRSGGPGPEAPPGASRAWIAGDELQYLRETLALSGWDGVPAAGATDPAGVRAPAGGRAHAVVRHDVAARLRVVLRPDRPAVRTRGYRSRVRCEIDLVGDGGPLRGTAHAGVTSQAHSPALRLDAAAVLDQAARQAARLAGARAHPAAATPVVFDPRAAGAFIHELLGHALEADNYLNPRGYLHGTIGTRLCAHPLEVVDDPHVPGAWGSGGFDDEGNPARRTALVGDGAVAGVLTTEATAQLGAASGNGRRASYRDPALPRATNTSVLPGPVPAADLLAPGRAGLLQVRQLGAGEIDPSTGEYAFAAREALFHPAAGEPFPLRDVLLVGAARQALAALSGVADDAGAEHVTCGKNGQHIGIGLLAPSLRFERLEWW